MTTKKWTLWIVIVAAIAACVFATIAVLRRERRADIAERQTAAPLKLSSASLTDGSTMPRRLTCDAANLSPEIQLPQPAPVGTRSFAIVMDDRDTPLRFVHWIAYDIPVEAHAIPEGASSQASLPAGAAEGLNDFGKVGYGGPCPPGAKPHRYVLRLYALDLMPSLPAGKTKEQLAAAVKGHVLAEGEITGFYGRGGQ